MEFGDPVGALEIGALVGWPITGGPGESVGTLELGDMDGDAVVEGLPEGGVGALDDGLDDVGKEDGINVVGR